MRKFSPKIAAGAAALSLGVAPAAAMACTGSSQQAQANGATPSAHAVYQHRGWVRGHHRGWRHRHHHWTGTTTTGTGTTTTGTGTTTTTTTDTTTTGTPGV